MNFFLLFIFYFIKFLFFFYFHTKISTSVARGCMAKAQYVTVEENILKKFRQAIIALVCLCIYVCVCVCHKRREMISEALIRERSLLECCFWCVWVHDEKFFRQWCVLCSRGSNFLFRLLLRVHVAMEWLQVMTF